MKTYRYRIFVLLFLFFAATVTAQEVFLSISGKNVRLENTGDALHSYDFWLKPNTEASIASLQIFDAGVGGTADVIANFPDTKTIYEIFSFDSLYLSADIPLQQRKKSGKPIDIYTAGNEALYLNRWITFHDLDPQESPRGWILRVRTTTGDDINTFKIAMNDSSTAGTPSQYWSVIPFDLSLCLMHVSESMEIQIPLFNGQKIVIDDVRSLGEEDSEILVRDAFGNFSPLKGKKVVFPGSLYGIPNRLGVTISGTALRMNNLCIKGMKKPVLWDFRPVIVQRPKQPAITVDQLPGTSCMNIRFAIGETTRKQFAGMIPLWSSNGRLFTGDSTVIEFPKYGLYDVTVLLSTRGVYFPSYWTKTISVGLNAPPIAKLTVDKRILSPGELATCSALGSTDPEKNPLRYRWFVNDEFRSEDAILRISNSAPGTFRVRLVVTDGASNSRCTESVDSTTIRINAQPYAEVDYSLILSRSESTPFTVIRDIDNDNDNLKFTWTGSGIQGSDSGRTILIKHEIAGNYSITLTVSDRTGTTNSTYTTTITYFVNSEPQPFFTLRKQAAPGDTIFLSSAGTTDSDSRDLTLHWTASTGDTVSGKSGKLVFTSPGEYTVTLNVDDGEGVTNSLQHMTKKIHINAPPVPFITAAERSTSAKQKFSAEKTADTDQKNLFYSWDFGDGNHDSGKVVTHIFQQSGTYTVTLRVDDRQQQTNSVQIKAHTLVINKYPIAQFIIPGRWAPGTPLPVNGTGSKDPDGEIAEYRWYINGKESSVHAIDSLLFTEPGDYAVALRVKDNSGFEDAVGVRSLPIHINFPPVPKWEMVPPIAEPKIPVAFDATRSYDPDGKKIASVTWKFSDGTSAAGARINKTFSKSGPVKVTVTVDDGTGFSNASRSTEGTVLINTPPIIVTKTLIRTNTRRVPLDASQSYDIDNQTIRFEWILPDRTKMRESSFDWEAPAGGVHFVTLTADDGQGKTNSIVHETVKILVNRPPVALSDSLVYTCTGQTVLFNGSRCYDPDGDPVATKWVFQDGTTSTETNPAHVFTKPGYYPVTLTLDDGFTEKPTVATIPVIVEGSPLAYQSFTDTTICINVPLEFSGDRSIDPNGPIGSFAWDFGDGTSAFGNMVAHAYSKAGTYYTTLTIIGSGSGRCSKTSQAGSTVRVVEGPVAEFSAPERVSIGEEFRLDASPSRSNGNIVSTQWTLAGPKGSVTKSGTKISHSYNVAGTYPIRLTITIESGSNCNTGILEKKIIVNDPPMINAKVPEAIPFGDALILDASQSIDRDGIITAYEWALDGVTTGSTPIASIPGLKSGHHTISLTITDNSKTTTESVIKTFSIQVNSKPNASFTLPAKLYEGEVVTLISTRKVDLDGDTLDLSWKYDGIPLRGDTIRLNSGRHMITLVASDKRGLPNSVDSVQKEVQMIGVPQLTIKDPLYFILGTTVKIQDIIPAEGVFFYQENMLAAELTLNIQERTTVTVAWAPKGIPLTSAPVSMEIWDSLKFVQPTPEQTLNWNPSNPTIVLHAPEVNRPESMNVVYEWRKGGQLIGVGTIIEVPLTKGLNRIIIRAADQKIRGAHTIEREIRIACD